MRVLNALLHAEAASILISSGNMSIRPVVVRRAEIWSESSSRNRCGFEREASCFDYGEVSPSVGTFLRGQADRIRRHCVTSIIQIGKALNESKRHLSHGLFLGWIETEVGIPVRTAQAYMRVADWAGDKGAAVAQLSPSVLYLLSAAATPREFVVEILRRAENGERLVPAAVKAELTRFRAIGRQDVMHHCAQLRELPKLSGPRSIAQGVGEASGVEKLVAFLMDTLTADDFARVRELAISDAIISDPRLAENLRCAFSVTASEIKRQVFSKERRKARH